MKTQEDETQDIWAQLKTPAGEFSHTPNWLAWHPSQLDHCLSQRAGHLPPPLTESERDELREAHRRWHGDETSLAALERLGRPTARVIVTGQQPGLLTGPLLVLYKSMAAIDLARRLKAAHPQLDFVPVFWVASEDHDFDEIRRVFWPGHSGQLEEFLMQPSTWKWGQMIGRIPTGALPPLIRQLVEHSTFKTEFLPEVLRMIESSYGGDGDVETGFCRMLLRLLAGTGLVVVSPLMAWVRRRGAAILAHEFSRPGVSSQMVIERGEAMRAAGLTPTVHRTPDALNAFWVDGEGRRYTLRLQDGEVHRALPRHNGDEESIDQPPLAPRDLEAMLREQPEQFSANVVTRPLVQDSILPTVAQVIGPGEASYLAQVEPLYREFGVFAPLRTPRPSVTLVEPRVVRNLEKFQIAIDAALSMDAQELIHTALRNELKSGEMQEIEALHRHQEEELDALREKFAAGSEAIEAAFERMLQTTRKGFEKIVERILYQRQQDERSLTQGCALISNSLRPNDSPQERQLNPIIPFAVNYNLDWPLRLMPLIKFDYTEPMQVIQMADLAKSP